MRSSLGLQIMMMLMRMIRLVTISHHFSDPNKAMASNCNTKPHQHLQLQNHRSFIIPQIFPSQNIWYQKSTKPHSHQAANLKLQPQLTILSRQDKRPFHHQFPKRAVPSHPSQFGPRRGGPGQFREMPHLSEASRSFGDYPSLSLTRSSEGGHLRWGPFDHIVWESFSYYVTDAPPKS